jgi:hypothetical protein
MDPPVDPLIVSWCGKLFEYSGLETSIPSEGPRCHSVEDDITKTMPMNVVLVRACGYNEMRKRLKTV